jgi:tRNA_anti-like
MKIVRYAFAVLAIGIALGLYLWPYLKPAPQVVAPYSADNPMSSYDFVTAYEADYEKADKLYADKILFVRGLVRVYQDFGQSGGISLVDPERKQTDLSCWMGPMAKRDKALRGRIATVRGKVRGGNSLMLEDCTLVSLAAIPKDEKGEAIPSAELINAYKTDPAAAAARYENKLLYVRGRVSTVIEETMTGLDQGRTSAFAIRDKDEDDFLLCSLIEPRDGDGIKKEQIIVMRGRVRGPNDLEACIVVDKSI